MPFRLGDAVRDARYRRRLCLPLLLLGLGACQFHQRVDEGIRETAADAAALYKTPFLARMDRAAPATRVRTDLHAPWLDQASAATYESLPARLAIRAVLEDRQSFFAPGIAAIVPEPRVSSPPGKATVRAHLDSIAAQSNWAYEVERSGGIFWTHLPTRVFRLAAPQGRQQAQIGRTESSEGGGEEGQQSALKHDVEPYRELQSGLESLLQGHHFSLLPAANSVVVTAPPDVLRRTARLVERFNHAVSQRVLVELEIYLVDLSDSEQQTLDWSFLRENSNGRNFSLQLHSDGGLNAAAPFTLSLQDLSDGVYRGSELIFRALERQGATSVITRPRLVCLNNQVSELRLNRVTPYTQSVRLTERTQGNITQVAPEVETRNISAGTTIYILPAIHNDRVNITLSANYTRVNRFLNQTVGRGNSSTSLQLPEYDDTQFALPISLRSGETMVLAGNPRRISGSHSSRNRFLPFWGNVNSESRVLETVLLITAHILDPV